MDFHFNVIGVTQTKITNANPQLCTAHIPGYVFEYVPTPLLSVGVGMYIDDYLDCCVLERTSNEVSRYCGLSFPLRIRKMFFVKSFIDCITHLKSLNHILMRLLKNLRPLGNIL